MLGEGRCRARGPKRSCPLPLALGLGRRPGSSCTRGQGSHSGYAAAIRPLTSRARPPGGPALLTVTPEMMGALPSMSLCTSRTASSLLLSLNRFLESSSSASWNCSKVMVRQPFPLRGERAQGRRSPSLGPGAWRAPPCLSPAPGSSAHVPARKALPGPWPIVFTPSSRSSPATAANTNCLGKKLKGSTSFTVTGTLKQPPSGSRWGVCVASTQGRTDFQRKIRLRSWLDPDHKDKTSVLPGASAGSLHVTATAQGCPPQDAR